MTREKNIHKIEKQFFENIAPAQKSVLLSQFSQSKDGSIIIPYIDQNYSCMNKSNFMDSKINAISFFSGAGGLDIGAQLAGVKVLSSLDVFVDGINTLTANEFFSHCIHMNQDITTVKAVDFQSVITSNSPEKLIILGGPPCQPFSKAGYWVTNENRNSNDDPRNMIKPYFRIIEELKPDGFILENVESILHPSNTDALEVIFENMERLGYYYSMLKINAADYGIPQKRRRVFFLASKKKLNVVLKPTHGSTANIALNETLLPYERSIDWIAKYDTTQYCQNENLSTQGKYEYELSCIPFGKNYIALSKRDNHPDPKFVAGKRYWSSLLKLHPLLPSWTIIASPGHWEGPFHWKNRRLNIRELASLQTFPEDYVFTGSVRSQHKQIGNAVPPLLAKIIIQEFCRWI
jgi:DNA (cytosine-5)-methyltransferase 1